MDRGAAYFQIEVSGDGHHGIADALGFQPLTRHAPEVAILAVNLKVRGYVVARSLVGLRVHDETMNGFDAPVLLNEFGSQPVEQFRVRGTFAHLAEVIRRSDDALSKMMLPDTVYHHAGGERIFGAGNPRGQSAAAPGCGGIGRRFRELPLSMTGGGDNTGLHQRALRPWTAAIEEVRWNSLAAFFGDRHCSGQRLRTLLIQIGDLLRHLLVALHVRFRHGGENLFLIRGESFLHLFRVQLLSFRSLVRRGLQCDQDVFGQLAFLIRNQLFFVRLLDFR